MTPYLIFSWQTQGGTSPFSFMGTIYGAAYAWCSFQELIPGGVPDDQCHLEYNFHPYPSEPSAFILIKLPPTHT